LRYALTLGKERIIVDVSGVRAIDARFLGLLLMVRKHLKQHQARLEFVGASRATKRMFRLNGVGFLLSAGQSA
jgi:N-acetylglucosaminyldiphosphoundecaprenol N-acetyl-beta-D-mannosaminyltransferase